MNVTWGLSQCDGKRKKKLVRTIESRSPEREITTNIGRKSFRWDMLCNKCLCTSKIQILKPHPQ